MIPIITLRFMFRLVAYIPILVGDFLFVFDYIYIHSCIHIYIK